ncbi:14 kDa phosphohistidine phosphatase-like [Antedon mediterranea]|uniref:14 kDa phosphohistidine phosphatase-like n=1 Tax=Antedon mediterranea TaxID=105859 RepID=UPI003AF92277
MADGGSEVELDTINDVEIDENGVFKYVLIKVKGKTCTKHIVRGHAWAEYHADIYEQVEEAIGQKKCQCVGGGRINHEMFNQSIHVYGYSVGFGKANHEITVEILNKKYPDYEITWSNEGY